jgi:hypothetical protein
LVTAILFFFFCSILKIFSLNSRQCLCRVEKSLSQGGKRNEEKRRVRKGMEIKGEKWKGTARERERKGKGDKKGNEAKATEKIIAQYKNGKSTPVAPTCRSEAFPP